LYLDSATLLKQFGNERLRLVSAAQEHFCSGRDRGRRVPTICRRSDLCDPSTHNNPFLAMATAVTRKARWLDSPLHAEEALTREQAIRFYTINNAYLLFCEEKLGSLEQGKLADLVVLDTDLLTCPAEGDRQKRAFEHISQRQAHL